tara:strand:- start:3261 stop:3791 length:531 start_codon:yes stop_codon:yes gene_type:complete
MPRKRGRKGINATGRTKGDGQFLAIPYSMAHSEAFRSLSGPALKVWIELRTQFNGHNNGQVSLSFQRAADLLGMSKSTVGRAFKELEEKGFAKLRKRGQWYGRQAAEYTLTDVPYCGHAASRDWQKWRKSPGSKNKASVPRRHRPRRNGPSEYRQNMSPSRAGTRRGDFKVIDGAG